MKKNLKAFKIVFVLPVILLIMLVGCKTTGEDCENVAGMWLVDAHVDARDCDEGEYDNEDILVTITQTGCDITVSIYGESYEGEISGSSITWTGSYFDGWGTTASTMNLTVSGNSVSGTETWTYTEEGWGSCSGTSTITGSKVS